MKYQKQTLKSGIRLIMIPMKNNPTITISVGANVGARYEDNKNNGISHFLEHLSFKGTNKRTSKEITLELDTLGADYNASTGYDTTSYWIKSNKKYINKVLDIISDIYLNSVIPAEEIEKERGVILEEINMYEDNNQAKVYHLLRELLYKNQPLGASILGPKENIKNFNREDFLNYKNNYYNGPSTTITIAGDFKPSEIKKAVEEKFKTIPSGKLQKPKAVKETQKTKAVKILNKKTDQTHMAIAFRTFDINHKDVVTLKMLRGVLSGGMSSRLFSKMREELGICYYCYASSDYSFDSGYIGIFAGVGHKRTGEATTAILEILKDIKENGITEKELDKVKKNIIGKTAMRLETSENFVDFYSGQEMMQTSIMTPKEYLIKVKAVTIDDIKRLAKSIFNEKSINLAVVGQHKDGTQLKKLLKI